MEETLQGVDCDCIPSSALHIDGAFQIAVSKARVTVLPLASNLPKDFATLMATRSPPYTEIPIATAFDSTPSCTASYSGA